MGEGVQVGKGKDGNNEGIVEHFIRMCFSYICLYLLTACTDDVITTTIASLTTLSRASRRSPFGSVFLLNNVSYLRQNLALEPKDEAVLGILSPPTVEAMNSAFRTAKAGYFDLNFSPLMQAITDDPKDKSNKGAAKEKFTRFFDLFDEIVERHKFAKVLEDDPTAKADLGDEVVMLIVPSFQRFTQKQKDKEFSKSKEFRV